MRLSAFACVHFSCQSTHNCLIARVAEMYTIVLHGRTIFAVSASGLGLPTAWVPNGCPPSVLYHASLHCVATTLHVHVA